MHKSQDDDATSPSPLSLMQNFLANVNQAGPNELDNMTPQSVPFIRRVREEKAKRPLFQVEVAHVEDVEIPLKNQNIFVRIYHPAKSLDQGEALTNVCQKMTSPSQGKLPVVLFVHGGGWTLGSVNTYDNITRKMANLVPAIVVSVEYRLAPEHPYPAALQDIDAAVSWTLQNIATKANADPLRMAIMGDSGGANLATSFCLSCLHQKQKKLPFLGQVLFYPSVHIANTNTNSYKDFGEGYILTKKSVETFRSFYVPDQKDWETPYVSPLLAPTLASMPKTLLITAGLDPLLDEGRAYAQKLEKDGVPVTYDNVEGMTHGFLGFFAAEQELSPYAEKSLKHAADFLRSVFEA